MTKKQNKVLISPTSFGKCGDEPLTLLENADYQAVINPYGRKMTPEEVIDLGKNCVGIVAGVEPLDATVLESLPNLRCISRCGSGLDNVDLNKAEQRQIIVKNTPFGPTRAVAELTIGLILDLLRQISTRDRAIRQARWEKNMGFLLEGKTVGVLGLGRIGRTVAELLLCLNATVIGSDIQPDKQWARTMNVKLYSLDDLLKKSDIVCVHVSQASNNTVLIGVKELAMMKKGSYLVNLSRGGVVGEDALYNALKHNHLAGAAVDVFLQEPYSGPLTQLDTVVLTPHIGSYAKEARLQMEIQAVENLLEALED